MARPRAKRSLGQNFLIDPNLQRKIVDALGGGPGDPVLEIGAGRGALTEHLALRRVDLTAIELDDRLAEALLARYAEHGNVRIVHGDVMRADLPALTRDWAATRVVGNIPYNITTPILFRLLERPCPLDIVLMMQAEVADRLMAPPGSRTYGALTVGAALHAVPTRLFRVPRTAFRPAPRVDSTVVRLTPHDPPRVAGAAAERVRILTRAAFGWRRKQLGTILRKHPDLHCGDDAARRALEAAGVPPTERPEGLSSEQFIRLSEALHEFR